MTVAEARSFLQLADEVWAMQGEICAKAEQKGEYPAAPSSIENMDPPRLIRELAKLRRELARLRGME